MPTISELVPSPPSDGEDRNDPQHQYVEQQQLPSNINEKVVSSIRQTQSSRVSRCYGGCHHVLRAVNEGLGRGLHRWAKFVTRRWQYVLPTGLLIAMGLAACFAVFFREETDGDKLYFDQRSAAVIEKERYTAKWGDVTKEGILSLLLISKEGGLDTDVLDVPAFKRAADVYNEVLTLAADGGSDESLTFNDVCHRIKSAGNSCSQTSIFSLWGGNLDAIRGVASKADILARLNGATTDDPSQRTGRDLERLIFGNTTKDPSSGEILRANSYVLEFSLNWEDDASKKKGVIWEHKVETWLLDEKRRDFGLVSGYEVFLETSQTTDEAIASSAAGDVPLMIAAYAIMFAYASLATGNPQNLVRSQGGLACMGVVSIILGIMSGFGFCAAVGIPFVSITATAVFLIVGVGIDDLFIMMSHFGRTDPDLAPEERIAQAMRECGAAVTLTTLSDLVAFAVGASSLFPAIRYFSLYTGFTIAFVWLAEQTIFLALMYLDAVRQRNNRLDFLYCKKASDPERYRSVVSEWWCSPNRIVRRNIVPAVSLLSLKLTVLIAYCAFLSGAVYGLLNIKEGLEILNLVPFNHYYRQTYAAQSKSGMKANRDVLFTSVSISREGVNQLDKDVMDDILGFVEAFHRSQWSDELSRQRSKVWTTSFQEYLQTSCGSIDRYSCLRFFLNTQGGRQYNSDVAIKGDGDPIETSRITIATKPLASFHQGGEYLLDLRGMIESSNIKNSWGAEVVPFHPAFFFYEQSIVIRSQVIASLSLAAVATIAVTYFFVADLFMTLLILIMVALGDLALIGYMSLWGVALDSIALVCLVMSVGFSIDYTSHIAMGFMRAKGTRNERVQECLHTLGISVANGAFTTILATVPLAASSSYIFVTFFKMFLMSSLFGAVHGLILLPVLLSICGPQSSESSDNPQSATPSLNNQNFADIEAIGKDHEAQKRESQDLKKHELDRNKVSLRKRLSRASDLAKSDSELSGKAVRHDPQSLADDKDSMDTSSIRILSEDFISSLFDQNIIDSPLRYETYPTVSWSSSWRRPIEELPSTT